VVGAVDQDHLVVVVQVGVDTPKQTSFGDIHAGQGQNLGQNAARVDKVQHRSLGGDRGAQRQHQAVGALRDGRTGGQ
jgi:hypothetical protein